MSASLFQWGCEYQIGIACKSICAPAKVAWHLGGARMRLVALHIPLLCTYPFVRKESKAIDPSGPFAEAAKIVVQDRVVVSIQLEQQADLGMLNRLGIVHDFTPTCFAFGK
ncbi:MAG: hypothetical protein EKK45_01055 [Curvibacter sp.]|jgi:hypothetical protein|nr:MAG: hypothetical protein EKK45_01055 [Curvibacter sp.]